eukprot:COSAG02_NODE_245_length_27293_cov_16.488012_5_plen_125_part_00
MYIHFTGVHIGVDSSDEEDDEDGEGEDSDDEDTAPKKMDVLSIAVRAFLALVEQPATGISTADKQTISHLLPDNAQRPALAWPSGWAKRAAHGQAGRRRRCGRPNLPKSLGFVCTLSRDPLLVT